MFLKRKLVQHGDGLPWLGVESLCECCSSGSQDGGKAFSFSCVLACLMLYGCLAAREGPGVDISLFHRLLFPCLNLKTDNILGRSVPLEVWVTALGDV